MPSQVDQAQRHIEEVRAREEVPDADAYRALLRACAEEPQPDIAVQTVAEMGHDGITVGAADHDALLIAHLFRGRAEDAEAYLRALPWGVVTPDHYRWVLWAYAVRGRVDEVERLFEEFDGSPVLPDDDCRLLLLSTLTQGCHAARARRWYSRFVPRDRKPEPLFVARLIDAHGHPDHHEELVAIYERFGDEVGRHPEVAAALVHAFALADDPVRAEELLRLALRVVRDPDVCEEMFLECVTAYQRVGRERETDTGESVERLAALANEKDVAVEYL